MQIVLIGSLAVDQIMNFGGLFEAMIQPDKLRVLSLSVLIQKMIRSRGGIAGNIAYSLALLGDTPILYSSIGDDQKSYMKELEKLGVNIAHVHYSSLPTATFSVITDSNNCQVGGFYPGAMGDAKSLTIRQFADDDVLVVISAHDPEQMAVQIDECLALKKRLFFDIGQQVIALSKETLRKGIQAAEVLILNDYEMGMLAERTALTPEEIIQSVEVCIITLGERGSEIYSKQNKWEKQSIQAVKVKKVVDPTGAGDAYRAGFLYGYTRGWDLKTSAQLGSTLAAFVVEIHGTQEHVLTKSQITDRYKKSYGQKLEL